MKKMLLIAALTAATCTTVQTASAQTRQRIKPTMEQMKRAKEAMKKMKVKVMLPQTVKQYYWDSGMEDWAEPNNIKSYLR